MKQLAQALAVLVLFVNIGHGFRKVGHGIAYPFHSHNKSVNPAKGATK